MYAIGRGSAAIIAELVPHKDIVLFGTGTSGAMMITAVATALIPLGRVPHGVLVRKKQEDCHRDAHARSSATFSLDMERTGFFLVDDLVMSGSTLQRLLTEASAVDFSLVLDEEKTTKRFDGLVLAGEFAMEVIIDDICMKTGTTIENIIVNNH